MSFRTRAIWHARPIARMSNNCTLSVTFDTQSEQTKPTVTLFVLLLKYAHLRVIMTRLACRVMAHVPVHSPVSLKSHGGSHIVHLQKNDLCCVGFLWCSIYAGVKGSFKLLFFQCQADNNDRTKHVERKKTEASKRKSTA